jgi:hypothetical protein
MARYRDKSVRTTKTRVAGLIATLGIVVLSMLLSGCVTGAGTTTYTDRSVGTLRVSQPLTSAGDEGIQKLDEYGLFYSTNQADIVAIDSIEGYSGFDNDATIITNPDVKQVRVLAKYTAAADATGTLEVDAKRLTPGATYYYRFYTMGRSADGTVWRTLFSVGSHKTSDPTLKSLKKSAGTLSPGFSKMRLAYTDTLSKTTANSKITVVPTLSGSVVRMRIDAGAWSTVRNKVVAVSKGASKVLSIEVTAPDGGSAVYTVTVKRKS